MTVSIEDILALDDSHRRTIKVPEWNGAEINVHSMTALERAEIERIWTDGKTASDPARFRAELLQRTLKTADGKPWGTHDQIMKLLGKNAAAIERLFEAACAVNGFTDSDVEDLVKN